MRLFHKIYQTVAFVGLMGSLGIVAYSNVIVCLLFSVGCAGIVYFSSHSLQRATVILFYFLITLGFFNCLLGVRGVNLIVPASYAALAGYSLSEQFRNSTLTFHRTVLLYIFSLFIGCVVSLWFYRSSYFHLHEVVARLPWADIKLINALAWVFLGTSIALLGPMLYLAANELRVADIEMVCRVIFTGLAIAALLVVFQWMQTVGGWPSHIPMAWPDRFNGTFFDPNVMGGVSALLIPLWFVYTLCHSRRNFSVAVGPLLIFLILVSGSRSSLLILILEVLIFAVWGFRERKFSILLVLCGISLLILMAGHHFLNPGKPFRAIQYISEVRRATMDFNSNSLATPEEKQQQRAQIIHTFLNDRALLWKSGWVTFKHHPYFGVGIGNYLIQMPAYAAEIGTVVNDHCMNMYLQIAAEQGLFGLIIFLGLVGRMITWFLNRLKERNYYQIGGFSAVIGLIFAFLFGAQLVSVEGTLLFWFYLALMNTLETPKSMRRVNPL